MAISTLLLKPQDPFLTVPSDEYKKIYRILPFSNLDPLSDEKTKIIEYVSGGINYYFDNQKREKDVFGMLLMDTKQWEVLRDFWDNGAELDLPFMSTPLLGYFINKTFFMREFLVQNYRDKSEYWDRVFNNIIDGCYH